MNFRHFFLPITAVAFGLIACNRQPDPPAPATGTHIAETGNIVADTIIYDVFISNPDPQDVWTSECLEHLHKEALVDSFFAMVYADKAVAYDFDTREKLTINQVRKMESADGFSRKEIGKIQFTETWYITAAEAGMTKKVLAVVLGSNFYDSEGNVFGHKPVMRIVLK